MANGRPSTSLSKNYDVICFSHLRWDFVFQRPQHLMTHFTRQGRVFFVEEPVSSSDASRMDISDRGNNIYVCLPHLGDDRGEASVDETISAMMSKFVSDQSVEEYITWFYTPMMHDWARDLSPQATVYDCMDELSNFKNPPEGLVEKERSLFAAADVVFTGGKSLYQAKREQHHNVHAFPSSIDAAHFTKSREIRNEMQGKDAQAGKQIGFVGVIDERLDIGLLAEIADLRPEIDFVMVGPVVKISEDDLPQRSNISYLGQRSYDELPQILAGWDAAMMPFALNDSTKYISPTKTPEYLAAGLPVVSTAITDVVNPYGERGLVYIASSAGEFAECIDSALEVDIVDLQERADHFLAGNSWDETFRGMRALIDEVRSEEPEANAAVAG